MTAEDRASGDRIIPVGIGEMRVAEPPGVLKAVGIGSCVAVIIREAERGTGGMAHVLLPWLPRRPRESANLFKYADYAIARMVEEILGYGGARKHLGAKIVGGAHMFAAGGSQCLDVGRRNLEAVRRKLGQMKIPILGEDSGGHYGRSVEMDLESGLVKIRSVLLGGWSL